MNDRARTTLLLIRHAQTDSVGQWLAGRSTGISLNQTGRAQAERLRARLSGVDLSAIYSSPLQRAIETAGPLAQERELTLEPLLELQEIDFGEWTGERFDALEHDSRWQRFNRLRSLAAVPGGERTIDVQARILRAMNDLRARHPNGTVACVTHADVIRLAVLLVLGAPLDFIHRLEVLPASVTAIRVDDDCPVLLYLNDLDARIPYGSHG